MVKQENLRKRFFRLELLRFSLFLKHDSLKKREWNQFGSVETKWTFFGAILSNTEFVSKENPVWQRIEMFQLKSTYLFDGLCNISFVICSSKYLVSQRLLYIVDIMLSGTTIYFVIETELRNPRAKFSTVSRLNEMRWQLRNLHAMNKF